jgi:hypothetical protein
MFVVRVWRNGGAQAHVVLRKGGRPATLLEEGNMTRHWQLLLLAGALLVPSGAWADRKDGEKQRRERWDRQDRVWDDNRRDRYGRGRVWEDSDYRRDHPDDFESEKEWRKEQKERDKERREAWKEAEKDRREAARDWEKDRREAQREWEKDRAEAAREARKDRRDGDYRYPRSRARTRVPYPIP